MNSKLWMKKLVASILLMSVICSVTGCGKNLQKIADVADQLRAINRSILKVTNDSFAAGKVTRSFHGGVLTACENFSKALNGADTAIAAAKTVPGKGEAKTALDFAQRLFDVDVFPAFMSVAQAVIDVPPEIKTKIEEYLAAIRLLFSTLRVLFADTQIALRGQEQYV